jgi:hypothetical protein
MLESEGEQICVLPDIINFISDFRAQNPRRSQSDAVRAWEEVKRMDAPKTYEAWAGRAKQRDKN